jgi:hypothetical protein
MNITYELIDAAAHSASTAFYEAQRAGLLVTEYDAFRIDWRKTPVAEVRAEAAARAKAQKALAARIACERKVVRRAVKTILAAGYVVSVYDGEAFAIRRSTSVNAIMAEVQACDEEWLHVSTWREGVDGAEGKWVRVGTIYLVYGNSGPEVIADYNVSLETLLEPVMKYCETLEG